MILQIKDSLSDIYNKISENEWHRFKKGN
jgi:hypothetical protein